MYKTSLGKYIECPGMPGTCFHLKHPKKISKTQPLPPIVFHLDLTGKISMYIFMNHRILWDCEWHGKVGGGGERKGWEFKPGWLSVGITIIKFKKNYSG